MPTGLELINVSKVFDRTVALHKVTFNVKRGEIVALLGPSGCGKSTTLAIIAGLEKADSGELYWDEEPLDNIPPHQRGFGLMFQDLALFPHMNVAQNVSFSLRLAKSSTNEINQRVLEVLHLVGLSGFEHRDVNTLSGGEQQRIALARSLAPSPKLLMLDEPLGALDRNLRERLILDLHKILKIMHQTSIYVTHDQEEAFAIADKLVIMDTGKIMQTGVPQDIYLNPSSVFVAKFLGLENIIPTIAMKIDGRTYLDLPFGKIPVDNQINGKGFALLRPDEVVIGDDSVYKLYGVVKQRSWRGNICRAVIQVGELSLVFNFLSNACVPNEGERVTLSYNPTSALQFLDK